MKINNLLKWATMSLMSLSVVTVQAQGIEFEHGTWDEVVEIAKEQNKPIFVDAYTTWCGPCKWMAKNTFTDAKVGEFFEQNFIAYKMDMEKGEGPAFAKKHRVNAYPTLLYFSAEGEMVHKGVGARDGEGLLSLSSDALDPDKQLIGLVNKYEDGNRKKEFLSKYINVLLSCGEEVTAPFDEYWKMMKDDEKQSKEGLDMMAAASGRFSDFKHPLAQYFLENMEAYKKVADPQVINMYVSSSYVYSLYGIAKKGDKKAEKPLMKDLAAAFPKYKSEMKHRLAFMKANLQTPPDEAKIEKAYSKYLKVTQDGNELNSAAWSAYEKSDDPKKLKQALGWVNRSIEIHSSYANLDTKAALLYKLKEYETAKTFAEKAIKAAMDEGYDEEPEETVRLLKNINAKLGTTASK